MMRQIAITDIEGFAIGHAQDDAHATGCTVILCPGGAPAGVDIRGGGPASRETPLLNPLQACEAIHGVLLSGGSAYGLDAAGGVMRFLEEKGIGLSIGSGVVPLVCQSDIFDLGLVDFYTRPDQAMAYAACEDAWQRKLALEEGQPISLPEGNVGVGTGATVGKLCGAERMMKSGVGTFACQVGALKVGAIVCVNALGDVFHCQTHAPLAGPLSETRDCVISSTETMIQGYALQSLAMASNTTIGCIVTNAAFDKAQMNKIAALAQNGLVRTIDPVHTTADGDSIYALSYGQLKADLNLVGTLAAHCAAEAVNAAVLRADARYGLLCASDLLEGNSGRR